MLLLPMLQSDLPRPDGSVAPPITPAGSCRCLERCLVPKRPWQPLPLIRRQLSDEQWRERLSPEAFRVLRQEGTEPPFSSPLNDEKRQGTFVCAGCQQPLFASSTKFDSGTGWPSFWQPLPDAIDTQVDFR